MGGGDEQCNQDAFWRGAYGTCCLQQMGQGTESRTTLTPLTEVQYKGQKVAMDLHVQGTNDSVKI